MYQTQKESKGTVLLVEDDASIQELYAMALIREGVEVILAANGAQGVALALERHPNLILLDIDMPVMNGYDAAEKIRADQWGQTVPIIFLTNRSDPRDQAHASLQRPDRYVIKADTPVKDVVKEILKDLA